MPPVWWGSPYYIYKGQQFIKDTPLNIGDFNNIIIADCFWNKT